MSPRPPDSPAVPVAPARDGGLRAGAAAAVGAFTIWGLAVIYFHAVRQVPLLEVMAHRILWCFVLVALLLTFSRGWGDIGRVLRSGRDLATFSATTMLIALNWALFIYAIGQGHTLEISLGYFVNPLINVLLGMAFLGERLRPGQAVAVLLAAVGVINLALTAGHFPWVGLSLALIFGLYGLLRKTARVGSIAGLGMETGLLSPLALGYLLYLAAQGHGTFASVSPGTDLLLMASGAVTAAPLLLFAYGARRMRLSTIGLIQYLAPTIQFFLAVLWWHEPFGPAHLVTFSCIWAGLALYSWDSLRASRRPAPA